MCFIQIHQLRLKLPLFWIKGKKQVIDPRLICSRTFSLVDVIVFWLKLWWGCDIWASFWFLWKKKLQSYPWGPKLFAYQHKCSILTAPTRRWPCICSNIRPRKLWSAVSSCLSGAKWIFDVWCTIALKIHNKMLSPLFCTSFHFDVVPKSNYFIFS